MQDRGHPGVCAANEGQLRHAGGPAGKWRALNKITQGVINKVSGSYGQGHLS